METKIEFKLCGECVYRLEFEIFKIKIKYMRTLKFGKAY